MAQEITAPASACIPLPPGEIDQLAMLVSSPATAHLLLNKMVDLQPGDWVLQSAANSAVGSTVVQMAKARGLRTVNLVRRPEVVDGLKNLGADHVLVGTDDLVARIQAGTGGAPIPLALDAIGGETFSLLLKALSKGGTLVSYSQVVHEPGEVIPGELIFKGLTIKGFWLTEWLATASAHDKSALFETITPQVASGSLQLAVDARYGIDDIKEAVAHSMAGRRNGKIILYPNR